MIRRTLRSSLVPLLLAAVALLALPAPSAWARPPESQAAPNPAPAGDLPLFRWLGAILDHATGWWLPGARDPGVAAVTEKDGGGGSPPVPPAPPPEGENPNSGDAGPEFDPNG